MQQSFVKKTICNDQPQQLFDIDCINEINYMFLLDGDMKARETNGL